MAGTTVVEAAGGVLWRPGSNGCDVEVALVHRPKYDDWSLPKGKLDPGEHPLLGGLREVEEETGATARPGRLLGETRYTKDGLPKRVRYWAMRYTGGEFTPSSEVDRVMWLPPREARAHVDPNRDGVLLADFQRSQRATRACVVVRHASAGDRESWSGDDHGRPLDALGKAQAEGLVPLLQAYGVTRAHSADVLRCLDTLGPFTAATRVPVDSEPLVSEVGYDANPDGAAARVVELVTSPESTVICAQGRTLPALLTEVCARLGTSIGPLQPVRKGSLVVLHVSDDERAQLVAIEQLPAAVSQQSRAA